MAQDDRRNGIDALKAGRFADAVNKLSFFVGLNPDDAEARLAFALALSGAGRHEQAIIHVDKLLKTIPDSVKLRLTRAQVLEGLNRPTEAAKEYRQVLALEPNQQKALSRLEKLGANAPQGIDILEDESPGVELVEDEAESVAELVDQYKLKPGDYCGDLQVVEATDGRLVLVTDTKFALGMIGAGALLLSGAILVAVFAVDWRAGFGHVGGIAALAVIMGLAGVVMLSQLYWLGFEVAIDSDSQTITATQCFGLVCRSLSFGEIQNVLIHLVKPKYYDEQACKVSLIAQGQATVPLGKGQVQFAATESLLRLATDVARLLDMQFTINGDLYEPHPAVRAMYDFVTGEGPPPDLAKINREHRQAFFTIPAWAWAMVALAALLLVVDLFWMTVPLAIGAAVLQIMCIGSIIYSLRMLSKRRRNDEVYVTLQHSRTANRIYIGISALVFLFCPLIGLIKPDTAPEKGDQRRRGLAAMPQGGPAAPAEKGTFRSLSKEERQKAVDKQFDDALKSLRSDDKLQVRYHLSVLSTVSPNDRRTEVIQLVLPHLSSTNTVTKREAINVLKTWGDASCLSGLQNIANDSDKLVRDAAQAAIAEIEKRR
jgi:Tetratricopeptide repeat